MHRGAFTVPATPQIAPLLLKTATRIIEHIAIVASAIKPLHTNVLQAPNLLRSQLAAALVHGQATTLHAVNPVPQQCVLALARDARVTELGFEFFELPALVVKVGPRSALLDVRPVETHLVEEGDLRLVELPAAVGTLATALLLVAPTRQRGVSGVLRHVAVPVLLLVLGGARKDERRVFFLELRNTLRDESQKRLDFPHLP